MNEIDGTVNDKLMGYKFDTSHCVDNGSYRNTPQNNQYSFNHIHSSFL